MPHTQQSNKTNSTYVYGHPQKRKKLEMSDDDLKKSACSLIRIMQDAVEKDNLSNELGRPALKKLLLLDQVTQDLRRCAIQHFFLENGGCTVMSQWLEGLPDGTYPNLSVVQEILGVLDNLQIEPEYLLNAKKLGRVIKIYANDKANMPQVASLAKSIMDKWSRMVFGISTTYVERGEEYEIELSRRDQYRKLKQKLDRM